MSDFGSLEAKGRGVVAEVVERGLFGILAKMHAFRCLPAKIEPHEVTSSAQLIARVFSSPHPVPHPG